MKKSVLLIGLLTLIGCTNVPKTSTPPSADSTKPSPYYYQRVSHFESLPAKKGAVIFLGNSISDGAEWQELLPKMNVLNRGISGDTSQGVLMRLEEIIRHQPQKVFLLIGTNDISRGVSPEQVVKNIQQIATILHDKSPTTQFYVQSVLPVNAVYGLFPKHTGNSEMINGINQTLAASAKDYHYTYINLHDQFANEQGKMSINYSNDGLHLMGDAYLKWIGIIKPYLK